MTARLRAGILGVGFMGDVHAHAVLAAGAVLSRVAARTPAAAEEAADRFHAEHATASAEELISADDVDVVHVCTPNHTHVPLALAALRAGKAVICEKPLATTVEDARRIVTAAEEAGVVTAIPFVYRYYPTVREARARIAAGHAGRLWLLHGSYLQDWLAGQEETNWRVDPALGGSSRAFGDIGVHWCDLMEFVTGHRIVRLVSRLGTAFPERRGEGGVTLVGTEDGAAVLFETDLGATGSVVISQVTPGRKNRLWFSFDGTSASYSFDQELPDALWVGTRAGSHAVPRGPDTLSDAAAGYARLPTGHPQGYQDSFNAFVADVYSAVAGQKPDGLPTFPDGLRATVLTEAVIDSTRSKSWVEVPT